MDIFQENDNIQIYIITYISMVCVVIELPKNHDF